MKGRNLHKTNAMLGNGCFNLSKNVNVNDLSDEINCNGLCEVVKTKKHIINLHTIVGAVFSPRKGALEATCLLTTDRQHDQSFTNNKYCYMLEMLLSFQSMFYQLYFIFCNKTLIVKEKFYCPYMKNKMLFNIHHYIENLFDKTDSKCYNIKSLYIV